MQEFRDKTLKLFEIDTYYRLDEIVRITKYSDDFIRNELRRTNAPFYKFGTAKRNNARYLGKDLNEVFPVTVVQSIGVFDASTKPTNNYT